MIFTENRIFIFEFKLGTAEKGLKQIKEMKYHEKYLSSGKEIFLIGVGFDVEERTIKDYIVKKVS